MGLKINRTRNRARLSVEEDKVVLEVANKIVEAIKELRGGAENLS